jgi:hypothetical protein
MREHAASDKPVAAAISFSENASSLGAISRLYHASSRWPRDCERFMREILPKLDGFALNAITRATGPSLAACSRIRAGSQIPHARHWDGLLALVKEERR